MAFWLHEPTVYNGRYNYRSQDLQLDGLLTIAGTAMSFTLRLRLHSKATHAAGVMSQKMDDEFTELRIRKFLALYQQRLLQLSDNEKDLSDSELSSDVEKMIQEIQYERDRADQNRNHTLQVTNYIPALDEALNFLAQALEAVSTTSFESKLYDVAFSLGYYGHH